MEEKKEIVTEELPQQEAQQKPQEQVPDYRKHFENLEQQARELQQTIPQFDLGQELQNPVFLRLTAPETGITVEDAYFALHRREVQQILEEQITRKVMAAIQSGSRRPQEAGASGQTPSLTSFHYASATKEQREAFKNNLRKAWGRGETVYPRG